MIQSTYVPSGYAYTLDGVSNDIPLGLLASAKDTVKLVNDLSALYGQQVAITTMWPDGADMHYPANPTMDYFGVIIPGIPSKINVGYLISHEVGNGHWEKDPNGQPIWVLNPPLPAPVPVPITLPNVIPGINSVQVDYPNNSLNRALAKFLTNEGFPLI